ncbi:hypothetical protein GSbR_01060 [Geobacter sp. SVR]|nr:hypothetical protein GSVR_38110 [Geobacter sp. SVR]GCF83506.1 hypothetical protein GSbR_01060 [Geobacter sp. SVR]
MFWGKAHALSVLNSDFTSGFGTLNTMGNLSVEATCPPAFKEDGIFLPGTASWMGISPWYRAEDK